MYVDCYDAAGEYHQHDFLVYPSVTEMPRSFFDKLKDTGRGIMNTLFGRRNPSQGSEGVEMKVPDKDVMLKQCLHFYLKSYMKILVDGEYESGFKIDVLVGKIVSIYFQHRRPSVKRDRPDHVECGSIEKVSYNVYFAKTIVDCRVWASGI